MKNSKFMCNYLTAILAMFVVSPALGASPVEKAMAKKTRQPAQVAMEGDWAPAICKPPRSPLFQTDDVLDLKIKGPFPLTNKVWGDGAKGVPGEIIYTHTDGQEKKIPITLAARGKSRTYVCKFQPVRILWVDDKDRKGTIFDKIKGSDMKLTAHCDYTTGTIAQNEASNEGVMKEYWMYRLLEFMGLPSFKVRPLKVQYVNNEGADVVEGKGFFIEPSPAFGQRCDLAHAKRDEISTAMNSMDQRNMIPYLIGRLIVDAKDFVVSMGHNTEPFMTSDKKARIVIPYDFNDSGNVFAGQYRNWTFKPDFPEWFDLLWEGPFSRDKYTSPYIGNENLPIWRKAVLDQAKMLMAKKAETMEFVNQMTLLPASKQVISDHLTNVFLQLQRTIDREAKP